MGYMHITSLYKFPLFFKEIKEVYAMEKIHGTSCWIALNGKNNLKNKLVFHGGSEKSDVFSQLFEVNSLTEKLVKLREENGWQTIKIHGEGYGWKIQAMKDTYGDKFKFIVFDIKVDDKFLDVDVAEKITLDLGLEFVHYVKGPNSYEFIEEQAKIESIQAIRNGMGHNKLREGIVVRPINEMNLSNGARAIGKYKNYDFWETKSPRPLGERVKVMENAQEIADEWVVKNRFDHVIGRLLNEKENKVVEFKDIRRFLDLMIEDVKRESEGEVIWTEGNKKIERCIKTKTALMFKDYLKN